MSDDPRTAGTPDDAILKEMRRRWEYATTEWADIRKEGQLDMRYAAGEIWDPKDKKKRLESGRPCLNLDELSQYVNQLVNDVRQNKRAIKVTPMGEGANDETAKLKESLIRQIEYRSNAQQCYTTMFENTVQRSYGFLRIIPRYVREDSFDQELLIDPIVNPDMVTIDPDAQRTDGSDMRYAWIRESRTKAEFEREFPNAKTTNFASFLNEPEYSAWVDANRVQIAEYWCLKVRKRRLLLLNTVEGAQQVYEDELQSKPSKGNILKARDVDETQVMKYVTNGVEILERVEWPGKWIPIVLCPGKVMYVDGGDGAKRRILSLIRLARDPQMLYCYYRTAEAEQVGMSTKFPYFIRRGSVLAEEAVKLQRSLHEPVAFIQVEAVSDRMPPGQMPEMPVRNPFEPAIQALEVGAEGARRAIQSAIGSSPLPTQAQRRNEKSGVALKQIEETAQKGSFHFIDHYEDAITRTGAILDDLLPHYYDTARNVAIRNPDDSAEVVRINDPNQPDEETGQPRMVEPGSYDVTLSTGPNYDSEREKASDLADTLVQNVQMIAAVAGPQAAAKVVALAIKLKEAGPLGDEMANTISPPEDKAQQVPPEIRAQMEQMGQALQQAQQELATDAAKQQATIQKAGIDADADIKKAQIDADTRIRIAEIQAQTQTAVAEVKAGLDDYKIRLQHIEEIVGHENDLLMQAREQQHDRNMAQVQHAQALEQGEQGAIHAEEADERSAAREAESAEA